MSDWKPKPGFEYHASPLMEERMEPERYNVIGDELRKLNDKMDNIELNIRAALGVFSERMEWVVGIELEGRKSGKKARKRKP